LNNFPNKISKRKTGSQAEPLKQMLFIAYSTTNSPMNYTYFPFTKTLFGLVAMFYTPPLSKALYQI